MPNNQRMKNLIMVIAASCGVAAAALAAPVESPIEAPGPAGALQGTLLTPDSARGALAPGVVQSISDFLTSHAKN
jgi:hypothetical protein